jgi:uncharacterized membrane protein YdbT with pleckstrin-like domain
MIAAAVGLTNPEWKPRSGSVERRRDCIETPGIIGWTVRQTWFQRRAKCAWSVRSLPQVAP